MALCVICHREGSITAAVGQQETYRLQTKCDVCGYCEAKTNAWEHLKYLSPGEIGYDLLPYLSAHVRQATDAAELVMLTMENWRGLAQSHAETPVTEKLRKLLEYVAKNTSVGQWFYIQSEARVCDPMVGAHAVACAVA